jgi:hypothetical protein
VLHKTALALALTFLALAAAASADSALAGTAIEYGLMWDW